MKTRNQKGIASIAMILIIVGILAVAGGVYYFKTNFKTRIWCIKEGKTSAPPVNPKYTWYMPEECCEGLSEIKNERIFDKNCNPSGLLGAPATVCAKCGDGKCGPGEVVCNCPEDCKASNVDKLL